MHAFVFLRLLVLPAGYVLGCVLGRLTWKGVVRWFRHVPEDAKGVNHGWEYPE